MRRIPIGSAMIFLLMVSSPFAESVYGRSVKAVPAQESSDSTPETVIGAEVKKEFYPGGKLKSEVPYTSGIINGTVMTYHENGALMKQEEYRDGVKDGISLEYFEDGAVKNHETYRGGRRHGECFMNYPGGKRMMAGRCEDDRKTGEWTLFHLKGNKYMEGDYVDDEREGLWRFYSPEGWLDSEGEYVKGQQSGIWIYYDRSRRIVRKLTLKEGLVDGPAWIFSHGKLVGEGLMTGQVRAPVKQGAWKAYYSNGRLKNEGPFVMGEKNGRFTEYYENGGIRAQGEYLNNKRAGEWVFYLKDGKSIDPDRTGHYVSGKLEKK